MSKPNFEDADLLNFESKVNQVMEILESMKSGDCATEDIADNKTNSLGGRVSKPVKRQSVRIVTSNFIRLLFKKTNFDDIDEDNFIVKVRENRTVINKGAADADIRTSDQMDKFTFMQQIEQDAVKRTEVRLEREKIAQHFRKLGNDAYHKQEYEKAINMFTKAIDHVKDSPILYNNRALTYMKLQVNKRAIIDCDFVINKLDDKNLRAWLYRAAAYHKLGDEKNFETSIKWAKKNNSKELKTIDKFLTNMKNKQF